VSDSPHRERGEGGDSYTCCATVGVAQMCRDEESSTLRGHITSLAVLRTHRKLGLATKLMTATRECGK